MGRGERAGYKIVSEETWEAIKAAYLRGVSAPVLAAHYGVTTDAIYKKAFREGWTRIAVARSQARPDPPDVASEPAAGAPSLGPPELKPPPPPRPAPAVDKGRLAGSALEGAAALLAEGRLEEAGAYLKLADMGSRIGERTPAEAPTPEQVRRWAAALEFYTGGDPEGGDLPVREQWRLLGLLHRHGCERAHVIDALRRERRSGKACACRLCAEVELTAPGPIAEELGYTPATEGEAAVFMAHGAAGLASARPGGGREG